MAGYQFGGLNALPTEFDMSIPHPHPPQHQARAAYDFQSDLDMFTNTQFFDLDMGEIPETNSPSSHDGEQWGLHRGFMNDPQMQKYNGYPPNAGKAPFNGPSAASSSATTPSMGERIKFVDSEAKPAAGFPASMEEASRMAAEEDKRRRNTAASARFRVKKKQREQALERAAKDMTDRVTFLENRVLTLEMENKLLKDLITEKSGAGAIADLELLRRRAESKDKSEEPERKRSKTEPSSGSEGSR